MAQSFKEYLLYKSLNEAQAERAGSKWVAADYELVLRLLEAYKRIAIIKRGADPVDGTNYGDLDDADIEYIRQHPYDIHYPFIDKYIKKGIVEAPNETPKENVKAVRISKTDSKGN